MQNGGEEEKQLTEDLEKGMKALTTNDTSTPAAPPCQTAGRDSGGLALQVAVQEEKEIQASHVPEKEQEAEGESRDLSGRLCASDLDAVQYFGCSTGSGRRQTNTRPLHTFSTDIHRRRSRSTSRERERRRRDRDRSHSRDRDRDRDRDRRRTRSRSPHRRRSRTPPRRHRSSSLSPSRQKQDDDRKDSKAKSAKPIQISAEDMQGKTEEEIEMMKLMGFSSFDSTKSLSGCCNAE
ncbi:U4/U6.U5 small nuclear ribonucleoprotein 27 kDa protein [Oryzias melastigma]|uniref:U4/U6.U5 small nuclear ribonucleoprotein 27 kDa protein n=1 Tax=Oryzias melastigma TaxID=30732 RepID=A0A834F3B1_ORYME|nr:U4/U6.U5 small nuclear ribonucleoprotein 27 kDa protein [Oryzias melastigma]